MAAFFVRQPRAEYVPRGSIHFQALPRVYQRSQGRYHGGWKRRRRPGPLGGRLVNLVRA